MARASTLKRLSGAASPGILRDARDLIADQARWATHDTALDADDLPVNAKSKRACRWCAYGAVIRSGGTARGAEVALLAGVASEQHARPIGDVNDRLGHAAVMAMFGTAIALAEARA